MNDDTITVQGRMSGLRWNGLYELLYDLAIAHHVQLIVTEERTGWIRTTIFFKLSGKRSAVAACSREIERIVEEHNVEPTK